MYDPIGELDTERAAERVAADLRSAREAVPLLPSSAGDVRVLGDRLASLKDGAIGSVRRDADPMAFLGGFPFDGFRGQRAVFSPYWAHSAGGRDFSPGEAVVEALFEDAAARWAADGWRLHLIELAAPDSHALGAWSWLGFAPQAVDAVRGVDPVDGDAVPVRRAQAADASIVAGLEARLQDHLAASPIFLSHSSGSDTGAWTKRLTDSDHAVWLAGEEGDAAQGYLVIGPASSRASEIVMDPGTAGITGAFTVPNRRREGVATALLAAAVDWARERGFDRVSVDFEPMNPPARRFWLRHFEIVAVTVGRSLDPLA